MKTLSILLLFSPLVSYSQSDWQSLFDGKTLQGWEKRAGSATFSVQEGAIVGTTVEGSPNTFLVQERKFMDDFILEVEIMLEDTTGNSGVQFRSNFDGTANGGKGKIFGLQAELDPTPRAWSGGIYDEGRREWLYPGSLNPSSQDAFRQGQYNKIRVECIGNSIKTWVNDRPVSYLVDTLIPNQGLIGLQVHSVSKPDQFGKRVFFRNIRIKTAKLSPADFSRDAYVVNLAPNDLTSFEKKNGWKLLFDGKSSKGWKGAYQKGFPKKGWEVKDGILTVLPAGGKESVNGGDIVTNDKYSAFDLSFEFKLTPGANSGVKYFVTLSENNSGSAIGLEYQLLDDELHPDAKMGKDGNRKLSSLYDLIPAEKQSRFMKPIGQWNRGRIVVHPNNHVVHYLNGVKVLEYDRGSEEYRKLVAISKYNVWKDFGEAEKGHILLQDHGNEVSFRSIKLRRL